MISAAELLSLYKAARTLAEVSLDVTEQTATLRDDATEKGFDWSQLKALAKASVQDERDGKGRVARLLERADHAMAYATMLGISEPNMNEKNFFTHQVTKSLEVTTSTNASDDTPPAVPESPVTVSSENGLPEMPEFLRRFGAAIEGASWR